jgi:hypothetical protein
MTDTMWIRGENGAIHEMSVPLSPHIQRRIDRGDLTHVTEDGSPWVEPDDSGQEPEGSQPPDAPPLPKRTENRAVWTDFAVSQGMDREQAAAMTKNDLIGVFSTTPPVSE